MESIAELKLQPLLEAIASREPAPGSGSAASVALALGLACARKAVGITLKHHPELERPDAIEARLAELAEQTLPLGDQDAALFPASLGGDSEARAALQQLGRRTADHAEAAREEIARAAAVIHPRLRGDIAAAQALVEAAATIIRSNLAEAQSGST